MKKYLLVGGMATVLLLGACDEGMSGEEDRPAEDVTEEETTEEDTE